MRTNEGQAKASGRTEQIQHQMQALASRDVQLWSITLLIIVVLASGFAAVVLPNISWNTANLRVESRYLPQVFFGLISLILLFNFYVLSQKKSLAETRKALVQELIFNGQAEGVALIDPVTRLFNRRALDQMLGKEVVRANRLGSPLSLLMVNINTAGKDPQQANTREDDKLLEEVSHIMTATFRGADVVFRYAEFEFLVVMPDTSEQQAELALKRFELQVDGWQQESPLTAVLEMSSAVGSYVIGARIADLLESMHRRLFLKKHKLIPVF